jgi:UDPglucose 6-dehydrogenase
MTPWPEFAAIDIAEIGKLMKGRVIVDPYGMLDADACGQLRFSYFKLGSPAVEGK